MGCGGSSNKGAEPQSRAQPGAPKSQKQESSGNVASKKRPDQKIEMTPDGKERIVMIKYRMSMDKEAVMGEGTSSICRKGTNSETGAAVAIKVYKESAKKDDNVMMLKFKRQVEVLEDLQQPFKQQSDPTLWLEALATAKPSSLFMLLIDYSKENGQAGADPGDGVVYVITELAQYSLKDYLALRREQARPLPADSVKSISRAIVLVIAGLHAKGLVHIDLKPENLMMFNGRLKLIDVDGCVKIGTAVSIQDSSISFSPCYCAPEWASFLINEANSKITVHPCLDVWSVGMTICELVTLNAVLKPMYGNFLRNAHSHREAGFLFMDWLSSIKKIPLPKNVEKFDPEFVALMTDWLLVCDKDKRRSCAQSLNNPYILSAAKNKAPKTEDVLPSDEVIRAHRARPQDDSKSAPLYKGRLWKLNTGGNPQDPKQWLQRDMWLAQQGSLCYFSTKENKRLVLIDGSKLADAEISQFKRGRMTLQGTTELAFEIKYKADDKTESMILGIDGGGQEEYDEWQKRLKSAERMDMPTMQLGGHIEELRKFVVSVKNRRQKVDEDSKEQFAPIFKEMLWKLKADGDRMKTEDWFEREMWISKNGSLVYYSKKEERDLVYYTSADLMRASYRKVDDKDSCKPFTFQVVLPEADGVEFAPGDFAANTAELRDKWIGEFQKGGGKSK
jgi:serine/threonine protein kinase